jgi:hypothetical protein
MVIVEWKIFSRFSREIICFPAIFLPPEVKNRSHLDKSSVSMTTAPAGAAYINE